MQQILTLHLHWQLASNKPLAGKSSNLQCSQSYQHHLHVHPNAKAAEHIPVFHEMQQSVVHSIHSCQLHLHPSVQPAHSISQEKLKQGNYRGSPFILRNFWFMIHASSEVCRLILISVLTISIQFSQEDKISVHLWTIMQFINAQTSFPRLKVSENRAFFFFALRALKHSHIVDVNALLKQIQADEMAAISTKHCILPSSSQTIHCGFIKGKGRRSTQAVCFNC